MKALVVDGYNAIYKIPSLRKAMDRSLPEARRGITELAKEYQRRRGGIDKLYVVFDGKDVHREKPAEGSPYHVFSRTGQGDEEAVSVVRRLSKKYHVEVVTSDNFIRNNSRAYNATVISIPEFIAFLNKGQRTTVEKAAEKITPEIASQINEELKRYWKIS